MGARTGSVAGHTVCVARAVAWLSSGREIAPAGAAGSLAVRRGHRSHRTARVAWLQYRRRRPGGAGAGGTVCRPLDLWRCFHRRDRARRHPVGAQRPTRSSTEPGAAAASGAVEDHSATGVARDGAADDQPVPQHHQVNPARRGGGIPGTVPNLCRHRDDAVEPRNRVDRPPDGSIPFDQSHRLGVHELVQSPGGAGGTMSDVVAGQRQPSQGGLLPRRAGGRPPGALHWGRRNLFSSVFNSLLTGIVLLLAWLVLPPLFRWAVTHATISGMTRAACTGDGACWTFIRVRFPRFFYGSYPPDQLWRVDVAFALLVAFCTPVLRDGVRHRWVWVLLLLIVFPGLAAVLLWGGVLGLPYVDTSLWGGLMLDVIASFVTVAASLPLGILLAFGRRSQLPVVRILSVGYIEVWRGVPLLTVLFMSTVVAPLFLPDGFLPDRLLRAIAALVLFNAAYMAEVVRGGLQGVPSGQEEAAASLGLRWWHAQAFIVLPQALRIIVPGIINTVVDLFKDTTLLTIIGLFDLLGTVEQALKDPAWLGFATEGYVFSAIVFFVCCYAMSAYGRNMERRLAKGQ